MFFYVEGDDGGQVIVLLMGCSCGYVVDDGEELWSFGGMMVNQILMLLLCDGVVYFLSGYCGNMLQVIVFDCVEGEFEESFVVLWIYEWDMLYVVMLLFYDEWFYFIKYFCNILMVFNVVLGEVFVGFEWFKLLWQVYVFLVGVVDCVYFFGCDGNVVVLCYGDEFEVLVENEFDDGIDVLLVFVGNWMYVCGRYLFYCFEEVVVEVEQVFQLF